jgi:molybdate transport repressor ModE-like protein
MNRIFSPPLVEPIRGEARGGGAILTRQGRNMLGSFRHLEMLARIQGRPALLAIGRAAGHAEAKRQGA